MHWYKPKKKELLLSILNFFVAFGLLTIIYLLFVLIPNSLVSGRLTEAEKMLSVHYLNLIQNRIAYTELTKLDASDGNFEQGKDEVIAKIIKSNEEGLKAFENPYQIKKILGYPNRDLNFINKDLASKYPKLVEKNRKIFKEQKKVTEKLTTFDSAVSKLFAYNPESDLGRLDPKVHKEEMLERVSKAREGLNLIKEKVKESRKELTNKIDEVQMALKDLEENVQSGNIGGTENSKNKLYSLYDDVKKEALLSLQSIVRSEESVNTLKDQTNLILEYEFWLRKINNFQ